MRRLALAALLALSAGASAQIAPSPSHVQAAGALVDLLGLEDMVQEMQASMLEQIVAQNPAMAAFTDIFEDVYARALRADVVRPEMVQMYADLYTEAELHELAAFYRTPLGQKTLQLMPEIAARSVELSQRQVEPLLPEMQQRIVERIERDPSLIERMGPPPPPRRP